MVEILTHRLNRSQGAGLLLLRVLCCGSLFLNHGWEKIAHFHAMLAAGYPDPVGIGPAASLSIALVSDAVCSLLVLAGLFNRAAAAFICCNLTVALILVHRFQMKGPHGGEAALLYLAVFLYLAVVGPGSVSVDRYRTNSGE